MSGDHTTYRCRDGTGRHSGGHLRKGGEPLREPARPMTRALMRQRHRVDAILPPSAGIARIPPTGCRYITSDDRPWIWCDAPQRSGSVYCDRHHRISRRQPEVEQPTGERQP